MRNDLRSVSLPSALCEAAERRFGGHFPGIEPLLEFLLQEMLREDSIRMDTAEQKLIEQRLKDLGYV